MQNIDPVALLAPLLYVLLGAGLVICWRYKRRLALVVLVFSAAAYLGAIALKVVFQTLTYGWVVSNFGAGTLAAGFYFGSQTSVFEVGLAYLVARIAVSWKKMEGRDGEGYGVALAFWENAILLGALPLFNLAALYAIIANGLMSESEYQTLMSSDPTLFYAPSQLLLPTALGVLERFSSFLVHFSWGYLCVLAAYLGKKKYLLVALPIGLIDTLVPFAGDLPLWEFEAIIFMAALATFAITWTVTMNERASGYAREAPAS